MSKSTARVFVGAAVAGAILAMGAAPHSAHAEAVPLKFAFPATPKSPLFVKGMDPWASEVTAASEGTLDIKTFGGPVLGTFNTIYDRTLKGVADIAFTILGPIGGSFPKSMLTSLAFETEDSTESALAFWRTYAAGALDDEYKGVKVLALFHFPHSGIHTKVPVKTLADVKNMKLAMSSRLLADIGTKIGAVPVSMNPPEIYQGINRGVVDGTLLPWTGVQTFRVYEVTKYHLDAPFNVSPAFVVMNKKSYEKLSEKGKATIDKFSGEVFTKRLAGVIDGMAAFGRANAVKLGHEVTKIAPEYRAEWVTAVTAANEDAIKEVPGGAKFMEAFRAEVKRIRSGG